MISVGVEVNLFNKLSGNAAYNDVRLNVFCNNGASRNYCPFANRDALQNYGVTANPNVVTNFYRRVAKLAIEIRFKRMIRRSQYDVVTDKNSVADCNAALILKVTACVYKSYLPKVIFLPKSA